MVLYIVPQDVNVENLEEYLAGTQLHITNEESERNTFHNADASAI
jgi:hypothetical protein